MKNNFIKTLILSVIFIYSITLLLSCENKSTPTPLKVLEVHFTANKVDTIPNVKYVKPLKTNYGTAESD